MDAPRICAVTFFAALDIVTELAVGVLTELLYAYYVILMSETIEGLKNKFLKWKEAFDTMGLKVSLGKSKVMVSGGITKDCLSKSKVDLNGVCSLRD